MCGIAGIIAQPGSQASTNDIDTMLAIQSHRGPDHTDRFAYRNIILGSNRLSIIDDHARSNQPLHYRDLVISYNGAIYNYQELREELRSLGHSFKTESDTEVILAAYDEWGAECLNRFNGMWAFMILDTSKNEFFCSRDRFGIKPFYYWQSGNRLVCASEIKCIAALPDYQFAVNDQMAADYLAFGMMDHTDQTMFEGILQLEPGHHMLVDLDSLSIESSTYHHFDTDISDIENNDAITKVENTLSAAVSRHMRADVHLGACLSGGVDSSSIVSLMSRHDPNVPMMCYHVGYPDTAIDERRYVDAVIARTGNELCAISPTLERFEDQLRDLVYIQDEPFSTTSVFAQHQLFKTIAANDTKVVLDGQGADELFAGYDAFLPAFLKQAFKINPLLAIKEGISLWYRGHIGWHLLSRYSRKRKKQKAKLPAYICHEYDPQLVQKPIKNISEKSVSLFESMGLRALLHYEDRNSMAHSVESRVPFLDIELVRLVLSLPDGMKIKKGVKKYALREAMNGTIPNTIYHRHDKLGFETPHRQWLRDHRALMVDGIRSRLQSDSLIDLRHVDSSLDLDHLFRLYLYALWRSVFESD